MRAWSERTQADEILHEYRREYKRRFAWINTGKIERNSFLRGVGRQLAHFLNDHSIRNRKGETWHDATVGAILHNPLYMGTLRKRRGMSGGLG